MRGTGEEVLGVQSTLHLEGRAPIDCVRLLAANQAAADFFSARMHAAEAGPPRRYLNDRGLGPVIDSDRWTIGYAPATWTSLTDHLHRLGFRQDEMLQAGLSMRSRRGNLIDRFRDRITIGVRDHDGNLVAFIARASPSAEKPIPKYINSPRTPVYKKSEVLFGVSEQQARLKGGAVPVLVEGPFDVLAIDVAAPDRFAAVAPCGTALTDPQVAALAALTHQEIIVAFDADPAGIHASINAYRLLRPRFAQTFAADLPRGSDPADAMTVEDGPTRLRRSLLEPHPLDDLIIDDALKPWIDHLDNAEVRVAALRSTCARIATISPTHIARQAARLAKVLELEQHTVTRELTAAVHEEYASQALSGSPPKSRRRSLPWAHLSC